MRRDRGEWTHPASDHGPERMSRAALVLLLGIGLVGLAATVWTVLAIVGHR